VTATVELLLPGVGSVDVVAIVAVLLIDAVADAETATVTVMSSRAPTAAEDRVQVTVPELFEHAQPVPPADTNVSPAGSTSVTVSPVPTDGPMFVVAIV
jgi:hypothetical protein